MVSIEEAFRLRFDVGEFQDHRAYCPEHVLAEDAVGLLHAALPRLAQGNIGAADTT